MGTTVEQRLAERSLWLPPPVFSLIQRYREAENDNARHEQLLAVWELVVRISASTVWAAVRHAGLPWSSGLVAQCKGLRRPAFGHWAGILREGNRILSAHPARVGAPAVKAIQPLLDGLKADATLHEGFRSLADAMGVSTRDRRRVLDLVTAVVAYRNDRVHRKLDDQPAGSFLDPLAAGLLDFLESCPPTGNLPLVIVRHLVQRGQDANRVGFYRMNGVNATPDEQPTPPGMGRLDVDRPFLMQELPGGAAGLVPHLLIPLHPMAVAGTHQGRPVVGWLEEGVQEPNFLYSSGSGVAIDRHLGPSEIESLYGQTHRAPTMDPTRPPWRGLGAYQEADSQDFYGREEDVLGILARLGSEGCAVIVGASGSGRSSLLRAGIVPRLRVDATPSDEVLPLRVLLLTPGAHPIAALRDALAPLVEPGSEVASDADDTEEVRRKRLLLGHAEWMDRIRKAFDTPPETIAPEALIKLAEDLPRFGFRLALCVDPLDDVLAGTVDPAEGGRFLDLIGGLGVHASKLDAQVVLTLRADALPAISQHPAFRDALSSWTMRIRPPDPDRLQRIIRRPALLRELVVEEGLSETLIHDLGEGAGVLSLLGCTMERLWATSQRAPLTIHAYHAQGGVAGMVCALADEAHREATERAQPDGKAGAIEALALVLTELGVITQAGGIESTSASPSHLAEVTGLGRDALENLLEPFFVRRVFVRDHDEAAGSRIEVAHEAVLREWPFARDLFRTDRDLFDLRHDISRDAKAWGEAGAWKRAGRLWRGGEKLDRAFELLGRKRLGVGIVEIRFLRASRRLARMRRIAAFLALGIPLVVLWWWNGNKQEKDWLNRENAIQMGDEAGSAIQQGQAFRAASIVRQAMERADSLSMRALWYRVGQQPNRWKQKMSGQINGLAFSPDGSRLAVGASGKEVKIVDTRTNESFRLGGGGDDNLYVVAFSPDGSLLASGSGKGAILVWNLEGGLSGAPPVATVFVKAHEATVSALAFDPSGQLLLSADFDGSVKLRYAVSGKVIQVFEKVPGAISNVAWSADGTQVLASCEDGLVYAWNARTAEKLGTFVGNVDGITDFARSPAGDQLATVSFDGSMRFWTVSDRQQKGAAVETGADIFAVAWSSRGQVATGGVSQDIYLWEPDGTTSRVIKGHSLAILDLAFSPDGNLLASGDDGGNVSLWDLRMNRPLFAERGHEGTVEMVAFHPAGTWLASGGQEGLLRFWDPATGLQTRVLGGLGAALRSLIASPTGDRLAIGGADGAVRILDVASGRLVAHLLGHGDAVESMDWSDDGRLLVSAGWDGQVLVWDLASGRHEPPYPTSGFASVAFIAGNQLAVGRSQNSMILWNLKDRTYTKLADVQGATDMSASPDRKTLAVTGLNGEIWTVDAATRVVSLLRRLENPARSVSFSPDGRQLVVTSTGTDVLVLDREGGEPMRFTGHNNAVEGSAFAPDGQSIATSSLDGTIRLWDIRRRGPSWRGVTLLSDPPTWYSQRGWLDASDKPVVAPSGAWVGAVERSSLARKGSGDRICLLTEEGTIEEWLPSSTQPVSRYIVPGAEEVVPIANGCVVRDVQQALWLATAEASTPRDGEVPPPGYTVPGQARVIRRPQPGPISQTRVAVAPWEDGFVSVDATGTVGYGPDGEELFHLGGVSGASAVLPEPEGFLVGDDQGGFHLVSMRTSKPPDVRAVADAHVSAVQSLLRGPKESVIAGYQDGTVTVLALSERRALFSFRIHGPVRHLVLEGDMLHALTDLGDHGWLDLSVLTPDYCDVMREIWNIVPVLWQANHAVLMPPPAKHRCNKGK